jgi:arsenical-resistance protein 2
VRTVAFFCGSSSGRGPRCAGWFADVVREEKGGEGLIQAMTLEGGIKGWIAAGREYTELVDGYDEQYWRQI